MLTGKGPALLTALAAPIYVAYLEVTIAMVILVVLLTFLLLFAWSRKKGHPTNPNPL